MRCWCVGKARQQDIDRGLRPLTARAAGLVDITCTQKADILLKCDADVWEDCDYLAAAPPNRRQDIETCVGINYHPDGTLFDRALRRSFKPSTSHRYDALHVLLSNGLLAQEIVLLFKYAKQHARVTSAHFREYSEVWRWEPTCRLLTQSCLQCTSRKSKRHIPESRCKRTPGSVCSVKGVGAVGIQKYLCDAAVVEIIASFAGCWRPCFEGCNYAHASRPCRGRCSQPRQCFLRIFAGLRRRSWSDRNEAQTP